MSVSILNILCEGYSEQRFASKVLKKYLLPHDIVVRTSLLVTNRKLQEKGGIIDFQQVQRDFCNMVKSCRDTQYETNYFTTMFDLYALPPDFPGYCQTGQNPYQYVRNIEIELAKTFDCHRFIPYIELHEFETLILCNLKRLGKEYPNASDEIIALDKEWRAEYKDNAELVNTSREAAPSKRIIKALEGKYRYNKPQMAEIVTEDMGIDGLRQVCNHFNQWVEKLLEISPTVPAYRKYSL